MPSKQRKIRGDWPVNKRKSGKISLSFLWTLTVRMWSNQLQRFYWLLTVSFYKISRKTQYSEAVLFHRKKILDIVAVAFMRHLLRIFNLSLRGAEQRSNLITGSEHAPQSQTLLISPVPIFILPCNSTNSTPSPTPVPYPRWLSSRSCHIHTHKLHLL